jgi:hypothetical protein
MRQRLHRARLREAREQRRIDRGLEACPHCGGLLKVTVEAGRCTISPEQNETAPALLPQRNDAVAALSLQHEVMTLESLAIEIDRLVERMRDRPDIGPCAMKILMYCEQAKRKVYASVDPPKGRRTTVWKARFKVAQKQAWETWLSHIHAPNIVGGLLSPSLSEQTLEQLKLIEKKKRASWR